MITSMMSQRTRSTNVEFMGDASSMAGIPSGKDVLAQTRSF
jgi:hypothetical protein